MESTPGGAVDAEPDGVPAVDPRVARSRARVLDAAAALLREGGIAALTIDAVIARSGVARSTIYRHWSSRAEVVAAALEHMVPARPAGTVPPPEPGSAPPVLHQRLVGTLSGFIGSPASQEPVGLVPALLMEADRDPELASTRDRLVGRIMAPVAEALGPAVDEGVLGADLSVDDAVAWLIGPMLVRRFVHPDGVDARFVDRTVAAFLRAHGAPG